MSVIKSFSVGDGDMFYINHNSDNFTTIDCCYSDDDNKETNFEEMKLIIPGLFEPPVRTLRATIPENESHIFR